MKFTYNTKPDDRECVAYIDRDGDLRIRDERDGSVAFCSDDGVVIGLPWQPSDALHRFYPGDSITITFE